MGARACARIPISFFFFFFARSRALYMPVCVPLFFVFFSRTHVFTRAVNACVIFFTFFFRSMCDNFFRSIQAGVCLYLRVCMSVVFV